MLAPAKPENEAERLEMLRELNILDTPAEERFDRITRLAQKLLDVPIVLVSLVDGDRQWFKSSQGLSASETPRDISFCGHAILSSDTLNVPDATLDERFHDNPLVTEDPHIRLYAGHPLTMPNGLKAGTFCAIDRRPRQLSDEELDTLRDLAAIAEQELNAMHLVDLVFELKTFQESLVKSKAQLEKHNQILRKFFLVDKLTDLPNQRHFDFALTNALNQANRSGEPFTLLLLDLDDFKGYNDRFGRLAGDETLRSVAKALQKEVRPPDVLSRFEEDIFAVLAPGSGGEPLADSLSLVVEALGLPNPGIEADRLLTVTVGGVMVNPGMSVGPATVISRAKRAVELGKRGGPNTVKCLLC